MGFEPGELPCPLSNNGPDPKLSGSKLYPGYDVSRKVKARARRLIQGPLAGTQDTDEGGGISDRRTGSRTWTDPTGFGFGLGLDQSESDLTR